MPSKKAATSGLLLLLTGCCLVTQGTYQEVKINSDPQGASFTFEGKEYRTPDTVNLPKKEITLVLTKEGYEDATYELKLRTSPYFYGSLLIGALSGLVDWLTGAWLEFEQAEVTVPLTEKGDVPIVRDLKVESIPEGAAIHMSGGVHGMTDTTLKLRWMPGVREQTIVLKLPGYEDLRLVVLRGATTVKGTLVKKPVIVTAQFESIPAGAKVTVGELTIGQTPLAFDFAWEPKTEPREAVFELAGYVTKKETFTQASAKIEARLEEEVRKVPVKLDVVPAVAFLELDGAPYGPAPAELPLAWSISRKEYTLVFSCPGYRSETVSVKTDRKELTVRLKPMLPKLP